MSVTLTKHGQGQSTSSVAGNDAGSQFREWSISQLQAYDGYCSSNDLAALERTGISKFGLSSREASLVLEIELAGLGIVNERSLLKELDDSLARFTAITKRLTPKDHEDSIQLVCKPRAGFRKGLSLQVAEQRVVEFCRSRSVKVKKGFFSWDLP